MLGRYCPTPFAWGFQLTFNTPFNALSLLNLLADPKRHLIKGKDNVWKTQEEAERDGAVDMQVQKSFIGDMHRQRRQKDERLAKEAKTEKNFADVYNSYDPFKPVPPHTLLGNKRTVDINDEIATGRVDSIEGFKQPYTGADSVDDAKRARQRLHKHHNLPGARYDTELDVEERILTQKANENARRKVLLQQRDTTRTERAAAARKEKYTGEVPVINELGKGGSGAPNTSANGKPLLKLCGLLETDIMGGEKIPKNKRLAAALEAQIVETELKGHTDMAYDKHYSLHLASAHIPLCIHPGAGLLRTLLSIRDVDGGA